MRADEERLGQVFVNLVHNAVKFSPDGGEVASRSARATGSWSPSSTTGSGSPRPTGPGSSSASTRPTGRGRAAAARASASRSPGTSSRATAADPRRVRGGPRLDVHVHAPARPRDRRGDRSRPHRSAPERGAMARLLVATLNILNLADRWDERLPLLLADMAALQPDLSASRRSSTRSSRTGCSARPARGATRPSAAGPAGRSTATACSSRRRSPRRRSSGLTSAAGGAPHAPSRLLGRLAARVRCRPSPPRPGGRGRARRRSTRSCVAGRLARPPMR